MDLSWYVLDRTATPETARGPFDQTQITELVGRGLVDLQSLVARVGDEDWTPAEADDVLAGIIRERPAPPPAVRSPTFDPGVVIPVNASPSTQDPETVEPYTFRTPFTLGGRIFASHYGPLVLIGLIFVFAFLVTQMIPLFVIRGMQGGDISQPSAADPLFQIYGFLTGPVLIVGLFWPGVSASRGTLRISDALVGFRHFGAILYTAFMWLIIFVIASFAFFAAGWIFGMLASLASLPIGVTFSIVTVVVSIAVLVLGIRAGAGMTISFMVLCDPMVEVRPGLQAVGLGWRAVWFRKGTPAAVYLVILIAAYLTVLLFCLGWILLGAPILIAVTGASYELLRRNDLLQ